VFAKPWYSFVVFIIFFYTYNCVIAPKFSFSCYGSVFSYFSIKNKVADFFTGFGALVSNYSLPDTLFIFPLAVLTGVNVSMMVFYYKETRKGC
jgi:hypothetical protein